ncbi:hypothetical protein P3T76_009097 [Phytophthora citrophthora]|uniref:Uncharacterized protein n=1 Tax=Phytophthora citrophthora TaxID=4793 RepID=A0AAD9LKG8_9STRA|nr:hypothetical protein P3T76_009097 [Phytophthora citrophthora]
MSSHSPVGTFHVVQVEENPIRRELERFCSCGSQGRSCLRVEVGVDTADTSDVDERARLNSQKPRQGEALPNKTEDDM